MPCPDDFDYNYLKMSNYGRLLPGLASGKRRRLAFNIYGQMPSHLLLKVLAISSHYLYSIISYCIALAFFSRLRQLLLYLPIFRLRSFLLYHCRFRFNYRFIISHCFVDGLRFIAQPALLRGNKASS